MGLSSREGQTYYLPHRSYLCSTYMHTYTYVHTLMHASTYIHVYKYIHIYTHTPTHNAHTYIQLHTYMNTHTLIRCLNIRNSLTKYEMWKEQFLESVGSPLSKSGERGWMRHKDGDRWCNNYESHKVVKASFGRNLCQRKKTHWERVLTVRQRLHLAPARVIRYKRPISMLQIQSRLMFWSYFSPW